MPFDQKSLDRALAAPGADTLADALDKLGDARELSETRRRDLASALRRVAAALDLSPDEVRADPVWLRPRLSRVEPAALGVSRKTWTNVLSDFRAALVVAGASSGRSGRGRATPLPPDWAAFRDRLAEKRHRVGLGRFIRFCANLAVAPDDVDDATLDAFRVALERSELRKDPAALVRDIATFWNAAVAASGDRSLARLTVPDHRNRVALDWGAFPASLRGDVEAYLDRLACADLCDPDAPAHPLAPQTVRSRRAMLLRFASALLRRGHPAERLRSLADMVEPATAREGLRFFLDRNGGKTSGQIANLVSLLKAVAKWHVRADPQTLKALADLGRKLAVRGPGLTAKNRARLRQFDAPAAIGALLALPDRLARRAERAASLKAAALDMEAALALAILIHCPMRMENLRTLSLERHLVGRRGGPRRIVFPAEEVKNDVELDFPLPPDLAALLDRFVADHRRVLNPAPGDLVFPKRGAAEPQSGGQLGQRIAQTVRRETGLAVNPHLFRHIGAKVFLQANPGAYEVVRRLLGHSLTSSTIDCYAGFETDAAVRAYSAILADAAGRAQPARRRRSR